MSHLREITKRLGERSAAAQQADQPEIRHHWGIKAEKASSEH